MLGQQGNFNKIIKLLLTKQRKGDPESSGIESQKEKYSMSTLFLMELMITLNTLKHW